MNKRVGKRGDTLIEVMLAVGIFSMVAVAVVAVMSGGTSSAQTALETTLAREEIDAQAEALRFIQTSYITSRESKESKFGQLWKTIISKAINNNNPSYEIAPAQESLLQYSPKSCDELYNSGDKEAETHGFIINTQKLGDFTDASDVVVANTDGGGNKWLARASTYPHLIFGTSTNNTDDDNLVSTNSNSDLYRAEGIYIIAVKDPKTTNIVGSGDTAAYYDFYIRTCWYGTGESNPSTISTVMRLYDPGIVKTD